MLYRFKHTIPVYVIVGCWRISWYIIFAFRTLNIIKYLLLSHISLQSVRFCMSKSVLVICPQGKYSYLPSNTRICLRIQLPVYAKWSQRLHVKIHGKMVHTNCIKSYFNQIRTFQNIGILNRNFHSNFNVLGRFYKHFLTSLYRWTLFGIFLVPDSKQKYLQVEERQLS